MRTLRSPLPSRARLHAGLAVLAAAAALLAPAGAQAASNCAPSDSVCLGSGAKSASTASSSGGASTTPSTTRTSPFTPPAGVAPTKYAQAKATGQPTAPATPTKVTEPQTSFWDDLSNF